MALDRYLLPEQIERYDDTLPLIDDTVIKGSYKIVATTGERDAIPIAKRQIGCMVCVVTSIKQFKGATTGNTDWENSGNWFPVGELGYTAEDTANKKTDVDGNKTSNTYFPSVKAVYDWATGLFVKELDSPEFGDVDITTLATDSFIGNTAKSVLSFLTKIILKLKGAQLYHGVFSYTASTWSDTTKILTLPACTYYFQGDKIVCASNRTIDLTTIIGINGANKSYFVYFHDTTGELTTSITPWDLLVEVPINTVYWGGVTTIGGAITKAAIQSEKHAYNRNLQTHKWQHTTIGSRIVGQGGALSNVGGTGTAMTWTISSGQIADEDLNFSIPQYTQISGGARLFYEVSSNAYNFIDQAYPLIWNAGTSRIRYADTSNSYALTDLANNRYIPVWCYWNGNDKDKQVYWVMPSIAAANVYTTAANARAATPPNLYGLGWSQECKLLCRIIVRGDGVVQTQDTSDDFRNYNSTPSAGTGVQITASSVSFVPTGNTASTTVQSAIVEIQSDIDNPAFKIPLILGETVTAIQALYIKQSDNKLYKAKSNSSTTMYCRGVAEIGGSSSDTINLICGVITSTAHGLTVGANLYVSEVTAGVITTTQPTGLSSVCQNIGYVIDADRLFINPNINDLTYYTQRNENFDLSVKLDRKGTYYNNYTVTGATSITIATGSILGGEADVTIVANGSNIPSVSGATATLDSSTYNNTNGAKNNYYFFKNADGIFYHITNL